MTVRLPRLQAAKVHEGSQHVRMHTHQTVEFVFTVRGNLVITAGREALEGRPGTLFILPGNVPHDQACDGPWKTLCVLYRHGEHLLDETARTLQLGDEPHVRGWMEELCALSQNPARAAEELLDGLLFTLLSAVRRAEQRVQTIEALHPRLADAVRYLQQHLLEDIDAQALAEASCVSYSHLSALFRERFGCGPLKYQQDLRLARARRQLLDPYLSIDEIARDCGYEDANYFVRLFRKAHGMPPGRWRKLQRVEAVRAGA
ncbi:MAG: AraC family transcriptional regulator [Planctomycetota bacterium]|nr:AraC family transcriptional regulator [Planctomycetota bacterium]